MSTEQTSRSDQQQREQRVLLLAPTPRDAQITCSFLEKAGMVCVPLPDIYRLSEEAASGAGAILLTEEVITAPGIDKLIGVLERQAPWSDLPVVMLMRGGTQSPAVMRVLQSLRNVTLLERPAPSRSVISAVQAAVRARQRQYQLRAQFIQITQAEARYRNLQQQMEIAIDASELGTFHCEMPLNKIVWNDRCKAHFWLSPDAEVDFDLFYSILHPDDRQRTRQAVLDCVERGQLYDIEYRTVSPKGEIRWVRATGRTFYNERQEPVQFDGTTQDVTARKEAENALQESVLERERLLHSERAARAEAEHAGRMKDEFLATLSHELRTPLNAILGWSQLIRQADDKETLEEGLAVIERNARVQVKLIEDLLDMSRIISGKVRLDIQPVQPTAFIDAAIETVMPAAEARGIQLQKTLDPRAGPIFGDPGRLQQVIWNLLSNAIKFTPKGGRVNVDLARSKSQIEISVTDTGKGINPEFLPHVFERFRQADASTTRTHGGLGLGLAIVKNLLELHGGTVSAKSPGEGKGATFTVTLPVAAVHREDWPVRKSPIGQPMAHGGLAKLTGVTVLAVDDEQDARNLVRRILEERGARVITAASANEALTTFPHARPDILISDIGMPGVDGYELLRQLRAQGADVPAIALTAFARNEDRAQSLKAGYIAHLAKPIEPRELITAVAAITVHEEAYNNAER